MENDGEHYYVISVFLEATNIFLKETTEPQKPISFAKTCAQFTLNPSL